MMRRPGSKVLHNLLSKGLVSLFQTSLEHEYGGRLYSKQRHCPHCGSAKAWGYDTKSKVFCMLTTGDRSKDIRVTAARYQCAKCRRVFYADMPFYPGCGYGKPVIDFCLFLAAYNSFSRVEAILAEHGIQVDRVSVKKYAALFKVKTKRKTGIKLPGKAIGSRFLKLFFGVNDVSELRERYDGRR